MLTLEPVQFSQRVLKRGLLKVVVLNSELVTLVPATWPARIFLASLGATLVETSVVLVEVDCAREIQEDPTGDAADARCVTGSEHPAEGENH